MMSKSRGFRDFLELKKEGKSERLSRLKKRAKASLSLDVGNTPPRNRKEARTRTPKKSFQARVELVCGWGGGGGGASSGGTGVNSKGYRTIKVGESQA